MGSLSRRFIHREIKEYKPFIPWNKGLRGVLIGKRDLNNHSWRGGPIKRAANYDWYKTRKQVLIRDNFICQSCGYVGHFHKRANDKYKLCVHHKNGYRFEKENKNDLEKLTTLCASCHTSAEWKLTLKYRKQLQEIQRFSLLGVKARLNI